MLPEKRGGEGKPLLRNQERREKKEASRRERCFRGEKCFLLLGKGERERRGGERGRRPKQPFEERCVLTSAMAKKNSCALCVIKRKRGKGKRSNLHETSLSLGRGRGKGKGGGTPERFGKKRNKRTLRGLASKRGGRRQSRGEGGGGGREGKGGKWEVAKTSTAGGLLKSEKEGGIPIIRKEKRGGKNKRKGREAF